MKKKFDMKILPICPADRERWRSNRFLSFFCGLDLEKGLIFFDFGGFFNIDILRILSVVN